MSRLGPGLGVWSGERKEKIDSMGREVRREEVVDKVTIITGSVVHAPQHPLPGSLMSTK